jgi:hypothetical protein
MRLVGKAKQRERARRRAADAAQRFDPGTGYFHGSRAGLTPGTVLLPASERGDLKTERQIAELVELGGDQSEDHQNWVFLCSSPILDDLRRSPVPGRSYDRSPGRRRCCAN